MQHSTITATLSNSMFSNSIANSALYNVHYVLERVAELVRSGKIKLDPVSGSLEKNK